MEPEQPSSTADSGLNPAQAEVLARIGASRDERPTFDPDLGRELRRALKEGLAPYAEKVADDTMFVSKHLLASAMGCERRFLAEDDEDFAWSVPLARGTIAHKAIELSIHWRREPEPLVLVDESISAYSEGSDGLADWLQTCSEVERAELRAEVNDYVAKFLECWPPLKTRWRPVTESRLRLELHGTFVLSGKVDLILGQAEGSSAGKVLIDLKTGGWASRHIHDLRFYALIETLRLGTPPRLLVTYYLDQGKSSLEDVTEDLLFSTVARIVDGVAKIIDIRSKERPASTAPGAPCHWCIALPDCDIGRSFVEVGAT